MTDLAQIARIPNVAGAVLGDLTGAGCEIDEAGVRSALEQKGVEARRQLMGGV